MYVRFDAWVIGKRGRNESVVVRIAYIDREKKKSKVINN